MTATIVLIFAGVFLGSFPFFFAVREVISARQLKRRLRHLVAAPAGAPSLTVSQQLLHEATAAERLIAQLPLMPAINRQIALSGVHVTPLRFLIATAMVFAVSFSAVLVWKGSMLMALLAALVSAFLPFAYLGYRKEQRSILFGQQLPEVLTMIARSLRAGHALTTAVELVGQELPDPTGKLFKVAFEQQKLGMRVVDSLASLVGKVDSVDFKFFITIIRINSETGGNLSDILDKLAETITSRQQIRRQVQVYTAEGRLSGYVLLAMPVVVFAVFQILRPAYMEVFFTQRLCQIILGLAGVGQLVGFMIIRKIVNIRI